MKIGTQLTLGAAGIVVVAATSIGSVFLGSADTDGKVINSTGIVRGGTQRLVKLELFERPHQELLEKIDKLINGLIDGDPTLGLPKATDPAYIAKMKEVKVTWLSLKDSIKKQRLSKQISTAGGYRNTLVSESEEFFKLADEAVNAAEKYAKANVVRLRTIQGAIFGLNIVIIGSIIAVTRRITSTLQEFTEEIAKSSEQITDTVERQETYVAEQADSVSQTTTTVDQLGASSRQSAEKAEASAASASTALALAEEGTQTVEQTMAGMENLKEKVRAIAEQILNLSEQTGQIATVSQLVGDLANQTNMLALNAAVEAARAGEHGKGFGVVAGEIRKLADESRKSANKINSLVTDVQAAMNSAVMVTDEGKKTAESSIELAQGTAQSLVGVKSSIDNVFANTQEISETAKLQAIGIQEILSAINAINIGAMDTAAGMSEVKVSTVKMKNSADKLKEIV